MKIIAGLGNPGEQYNNTRHNIGFIVLDWILNNPNWQNNKRFKSLIYKDASNLFIKPQTFMNRSGQAIGQALNYYNLLPKTLGLIKRKNLDLSQSLIVIHDDLDIELGKIKISVGSSSAGHKGVSDIIRHIKTKNFTRIRVGIKKTYEYDKIPTEKYVLMKFSPQELEKIQSSLHQMDNEIKEKTGL